MKACGLVVSTFEVVKVRLTGGEPLIRKDIDLVAGRLREFPSVRHVGVTTNGQLLEGWAGALRSAGVDSVNVSLDSLDTRRYADITGGGSLARVLAGIRAARAAGIGKVKVNVVVMGGVNDDEIEALVRFSMVEGIEARFLELMSFEGSAGSWDRRFVSQQAIFERLAASFAVEPLGGRQEQTARMYRVRGDGKEALVGIIGSSDGKMCLSCNRIRITADGRLRRCLKDPFEVDLMGMIRAGVPEEKIMERLRAYMDLKARPAPLAGLGSMMRIGG